jgi:hypothetical protein
MRLAYRMADRFRDSPDAGRGLDGSKVDRIETLVS